MALTILLNLHHALRLYQALREEKQARLALEARLRVLEGADAAHS